MKKTATVFLSVIIMLCCTSCSFRLPVDIDFKPKSFDKAPKTDVMTEPSDQDVNSQQSVNTQQKSTNAQPNTTDDQSVNDTSAFYGVWCFGSKTESDANKFALQLLNQGFDSQVFVTTDWTNLNPEKYYVVTAGICSTKEQAEQLLVSVKANGYSDAYIKYSGDRK